MSDQVSNCCYHLDVAYGQSWNFIAIDGARELVERVASIMMLRPESVTGAKRIVFVTSDLNWSSSPDKTLFDEIPELGGFPKDGWKSAESKHVNIWMHPQMSDIVCEVNRSGLPDEDVTPLVLSLYPVFIDAILGGGLLFHAALLEFEGKGILITGKSGSGKSTCFRRVPSPWQAICDDQVLIVRADDGYRVHPLPTWSDYYEKRQTKPCEVGRHLPLSGIFFLEQAKTDRVETLGSGKAAHYCFETAKYMFLRYSIFLDLKGYNRISKIMLDNACAIAEKTPQYRLCASLDGEFWNVIEKVLR